MGEREGGGRVEKSPCWGGVGGVRGGGVAAETDPHLSTYSLHHWVFFFLALNPMDDLHIHHLTQSNDMMIYFNQDVIVIIYFGFLWAQ